MCHVHYHDRFRKIKRVYKYSVTTKRVNLETHFTAGVMTNKSEVTSAHVVVQAMPRRQES